MIKYKRITLFMLGFLCALILTSGFSKRVEGEYSLPEGISFSGTSNLLYFFDSANAKLYKYDMQGKLRRTYIIKELGEDLEKQ